MFYNNKATYDNQLMLTQLATDNFSSSNAAVLNSSPHASPALHILYVSLITSDVCYIQT